MVASVTAMPRNSPRARRPGWRAMKRRTPFSVGSSSAPICTPSSRVLAEGGGERAARRGRAGGAARRRRARGPRGPAGWALRREVNDAVVRSRTCAALRPRRRARRSRAAAAARARTRTSPRASSRSRSSPRRSRAPAHRRERASCKVRCATANRRDAAQRRRDRRDQAAWRGNAAARVRPALRGAGLADAGRPIWVLDEGPMGGDVVTVNTWSAGDAAARREEGADVEARAEQGRAATRSATASPRASPASATGGRGQDQRPLRRRRSHDEPGPARRRAAGRTASGCERRRRASTPRAAVTLTAFGPLGPASESRTRARPRAACGSRRS